MKRTTILATAALGTALAAYAGEMPSFSSYDVNADGQVAEAEFVAVKTADGKLTEAEAVEAFARIDTNADGMASKLEFAAAIETWKDETAEPQKLPMNPM